MKISNKSCVLCCIVLVVSCLSLFPFTLHAQSTDTQAPTTPFIISAIPLSSSSVKLQWATSTDNIAVAGYYIFRNETKIGQTASSTTYLDTAATSSQTYTYLVSAFDAAGNNTPSSPVSVTTPSSPTPVCNPLAPNPFSGSWDRSASSATWNLVIQSSGSYRIENPVARETPPDALNYIGDTAWNVSIPVTYPRFTYSGSVKNFNIGASNLDGSKYYTLAVDVIDLSCNYKWSNFGKVVIPNHPSYALAYNKFNTGDNTQVINGPINVGSSPGLFGQDSVTSVGTQTTSSMGIIKSWQFYGNYYWYNIDFQTGIDGWVEESLLLSASADIYAPSIPTNLKATSTKFQVNLTWDPSTDNVGTVSYNLYREGVKIASTSTNSYIDYGLDSGTSYTYSIAAFDAAGNISSQSSPLLIKTLPSTYNIGVRIQTIYTLNVRAKAGKSAKILGTQPAKALGTIIEGPKKSDKYTWWKVDFDTGIDGWIAQDVNIKDTLSDLQIKSTFLALEDIYSKINQIKKALAGLIIEVNKLKMLLPASAILN
jgi:hypothetical protein